jgi:hypothetical protein
VFCTQASPLWLFGGGIHLHPWPIKKHPIQHTSTARDPNFLTVVCCSIAHCSQIGSFINQKQVKEMELSDDDGDDIVVAVTAEDNLFL